MDGAGALTELAAGDTVTHLTEQLRWAWGEEGQGRLSEGRDP